LFNQFLANDNMSLVESREAKPEYCFEKPRWFVPKETSAYEVWRNSASGRSWLFRDANTKEKFLMRANSRSKRKAPHLGRFLDEWNKDTDIGAMFVRRQLLFPFVLP
jgi:hypothetical protein